MSALGDLVQAIRAKIQTTDTKNPSINWDELRNLCTRDGFPRIEIEIIKFKGEGYISQRALEWRVYLKIVGYLKKYVADGSEESNWSENDRIAIADWGMQTVNSVYSILDDKQAGLLNIPALECFGEYPEVWVDLEKIAGLSTFSFILEVKLLLNDTEES